MWLGEYLSWGKKEQVKSKNTNHSSRGWFGRSQKKDNCICYDTRDKAPPHQFSEQKLVKISLFSTKNCRKILQGSETKKSFSPFFTYLAFPILISSKFPEWHSGSTEAEAIFYISFESIRIILCVQNIWVQGYSWFKYHWTLSEY